MHDDTLRAGRIEEPRVITRRDCVASIAVAGTALLGLPAALQASEGDPRATLFPGERRVEGAGFPGLALFREGDATKPLVVFLSGGGHLARIYYGHPEANPEDFLLTHLAGAGFSSLALSYPTSHPVLEHPVPEMTITEWARSSAAIASEYVSSQHLVPRIIAIAWSLAGRLARDFSLACRSRGLDLDLFVGLSAAPPLPGFGVLARSDLQLAPSGLRDDSSDHSPIFKSRDAQLTVMDKINGRVIIPREAYAQFYVADSPINFRGEPERYHDHGLITDIGAAIADQGSFDFGNYPLSAAISSTHSLDALHALTDLSVWGMLNTQALYHCIVKPILATKRPNLDNWTALQSLMAGLGPRLSRHVEGSHFFFIGQLGASATAHYIQDLALEAHNIKAELSTLLS